MVSFYTLGVLLTIISIGEDRKPLTPAIAAGTTLFTGLLMFLVVTG